MPPKRTPFGVGVRTPRSATTVLIVEPTVGFSVAQPETDLIPGQTPEAVNFFMRDGGLEPRSRLSTVHTNANPLGVAVTGGVEAISSTGTPYPLISGTTRWAWYSQGSWSALSYVGSFTPAPASTDYWDFTQIYDPTTDEMLAVGGCESYHSLYCWSVGTLSNTFSTLTEAPRAKYVTSFDNFLLAFNVRDVGSAQSRYVQRINWSDRGNPRSWALATNSLAGFEDLLGATGQGTRIMTMGNRVIVFFESEIWGGYRTTGAASFAFEPIDKEVGTKYSWTIAETPEGLMFLGNDFMLYLLPKDGGKSQAVGKAVQRRLRETIDAPDRAWAQYDETLGAYRLFYAVRGGGGLPSKELCFNLAEANQAPQAYGNRRLTRGFPAYSQSATAAITWDPLESAGYTWDTIPYTWDQMKSTSTAVNRTLFVGSSAGTMYHCSSTESLDDGTVVEAKWRSGALASDTPDRVKNVTTIRVDCQTTNSSHLTIRASRDQGVSFDAGQQVTLPISSQETQVIGWVQTPARYPTIEVSTEDIGLRVYRLWVSMRVGGI
jgi:hypothetical protein